MPIELKNPTGKTVSDLHEQLIRDWSPRIRLDEAFRDLIRGTQEIDAFEKDERRNMESQKVHSGRAGGIIEHALGLLMAQPSFHAEPTSLNTKDARESEIIERAIANMFEEHIKGNDFWPSVGRDILSYGRAFIKALTLDSEWTAQAGYPVRKEDEAGNEYLERVEKWKLGEAKFPFVITNISPLDILVMLDGKDNVLASIEEKWITAKVLAEDMKSEKVQKMLNNGTVKWYDQLPVVEYIDTEWIGYFLSGTESRQRSSEDIRHFSQRSGSYEELQVFPHGMGKHPVTMISGIVTGDPEYFFRWKSFLSDAKESLELFDFLLSRLTTMVWAYYLPSYVWQIGQGSSAFKGKDRPKLGVVLGGTTVLYADESLDVLPIPSGLPDALTLLAQADDMIQRHCAAKSDILTLADGSRITYEEATKMENFEVAVPTNEEFEGTTTAKAHAYLSPPEPIYNIIFESGKSIRRTNLHRIAVNARPNKYNKITEVSKTKNAEWVYCEDIKPKDYILTRTKIDYVTNPETEWITPDLALILGLVLGDGWVTERGNSIFRNSDKQILDLTEETLKKLNQPYSRGKDCIRILIRGYSGGNHEIIPITEEMSPVLHMFGKLDMQSKKAADKVLPDWAWNLPLKSTAALLRGLILSDGHITKGGMLSFGCYSENLTNWVSDMAHRLGCPGRIKSRVDSYGEDLHEWWAFSEFVDDLVSLMGGLQGKNNEDQLFKVRNKRTRRKVNDNYHREKVVSVEIESNEIAVCVVVDEGNDHIYSPIYVEHNTLQDVLFGRVAGSAPAFQVNLRIQVARSKLTPIAFHLASGISRVMELMLRGVQHLGEMVPIGGEEITPTMAKTYMNRITASITPKSPIDRNQAIGTAGIALEFGLPWDWIVEHILDIEDPATLRLMTDVRQLEQSEEIQLILQQDAVEQLKGLIEETDFEDADELDLSILPSEFATALEQAKSQLVPEQQVDAEGNPIALGQEGQEFTGASPDGAAIQSIQGGRGLLTENTPPPELTPGATQVPSEQGVVQ